MSFSYQVDREQRRMKTQVEGLVQYSDITEHMEAEVRQGSHPFAELIDARRATAALTSAEVRQCVHLLDKLATQSTLGPTAILVSDDLSYGMVRMLST